MDRTRAEKYLKGNFYGAPEFIELTMDEIELHSKKNRDYAFGGDPLGNFKRRSTILSLYPNLNLQDEATVAMVDMMKQLDAALWLKSAGHKAGVEGVVERLRDVGVYAKIAIILEQKSTPVKTKAPVEHKKTRKSKKIKTVVLTELPKGPETVPEVGKGGKERKGEDSGGRGDHGDPRGSGAEDSGAGEDQSSDGTEED